MPRSNSSLRPSQPGVEPDNEVEAGNVWLQALWTITQRLWNKYWLHLFAALIVVYLTSKDPIVHNHSVASHNDISNSTKALWSVHGSADLLARDIVAVKKADVISVNGLQKIITENPDFRDENLVMDIMKFRHRVQRIIQ